MMTEREKDVVNLTDAEDKDAENLIQEFKNYPDMCRRLNLEIKTGGAKQNQMKDLEKRFHLEVSRQKITLRGRGKEEIERCEAEERRGREKNLNEKISVNKRKFLLMWEIREILRASREIPEDSTSSNGLAVDFSFSQLDDLLGLVNKSFSENIRTTAEENFCSEVRNKNKEVTLSLCDSIIASGLASGYKTVSVKKQSGEIIVVPAEELYIILDIETNVFKEMEVTGKQQIHLTDRWREFVDLRDKKLLELYGITKIWSTFLFFTTENICDWFLENNARIFHVKEKLKFELNQVNMQKLELHMRKTYQESLTGKYKVKMTVPKLNGFAGVYDDEGKCIYEEIEVEREKKKLPEDYLEKREKMMVERVLIGEGK